MNPQPQAHVPVQKIVLYFIGVIIIGVIIAILATVYRIKDVPAAGETPTAVLSEAQKIQYLERLNQMSEQTTVLTPEQKSNYLKRLNNNK